MKPDIGEGGLNQVMRMKRNTIRDMAKDARGDLLCVRAVSFVCWFVLTSVFSNLAFKNTGGQGGPFVLSLDLSLKEKTKHCTFRV